MAETNLESWFSIGGVAALFGVDRKTVRAWVARLPPDAVRAEDQAKLIHIPTLYREVLSHRASAGPASREAKSLDDRKKLVDIELKELQLRKEQRKEQVENRELVPVDEIEPAIFQTTAELRKCGEQMSRQWPEAQKLLNAALRSLEESWRERARQLEDGEVE